MTRGTSLNISAGVASVTVALTLVALKLWALGMTSSLSVAASLADSALDLMMSGGLMAIFYAARPADEDHAFGHTSVEDLAALAQSIFILVSGGAIAWSAVHRLMSDTPTRLGAQGPGMAVMALSILLTLALVLWQRRVASRTGSRVVAADLLHYLSDLIPNIGAIAAPSGCRASSGLARWTTWWRWRRRRSLWVGSLRIGKGAWTR
ncbi:MAG: cation diffusion facilitator family transporter [Defluviimonas denitrificans]